MICYNILFTSSSAIFRALCHRKGKHPNPALEILKVTTSDHRPYNVEL